MKVKKRVDVAIFMRLSRVGEILTNHAKSIDAGAGYTDRTGNLRSSTGYVVVMNGVIVKTEFDQVLDGSQGVNIGLAYAEKIAEDYTDNHAVIVVAGMEYALAIESRGKDVLTSTEYLAETIVPEQLAKLRESIKKMRLV